MAGLSMALLEFNVKEIRASLDAALAHFMSRSHFTTFYFATRTALLFHEILRDRRLFREAALQLIRVTNSTSELISGLLIEQAALCFFKIPPSGWRRKSAFLTSLAGGWYSKCALPGHATRCVTSASRVYENKRWPLIHNHLLYTRAQIATSVSDNVLTTELLGRLLASERITSTMSEQCFAMLASMGIDAEAFTASKARERPPSRPPRAADPKKNAEVPAVQVASESEAFSRVDSTKRSVASTGNPTASRPVPIAALIQNVQLSHHFHSSPLASVTLILRLKNESATEAMVGLLELLDEPPRGSAACSPSRPHR